MAVRDNVVDSIWAETTTPQTFLWSYATFLFPVPFDWLHVVDGGQDNVLQEKTLLSSHLTLSLNFQAE